MILTVLIATIPDRFDIFSKLSDELFRQKTYLQTTHPSLGEVQILVDGSKKYLDGGLSIGAKRQSLLERAHGDYVCFLDDDESIAPNYLETLVRLCHKRQDVCTFRNLSKMANFWTVIDMGLHYPNDQASPMFMTRRKPWHICPVKREFARLYRFEDVNYGEDFGWMEKVLTHCTTEAKTDAIIHVYNHGTHSEADKITNHVQSERRG